MGGKFFSPDGANFLNRRKSPFYWTIYPVYLDHKQERSVRWMYEIEFVRGHVEVYLDGAFCFSADTRGEAEAEIAEMTA